MTGQGSALLERQATRRAVLAGAVLLVAAVLPVSAVDSGPVVCPVRRLTGRPCPGCGLTRSLNRTLHGRLGQAAAAHPAGPAAAALLGAWALTGPVHAGTVLDPRTWTTSRARRASFGLTAVAWLAWAGWRAFS